MNSRSPARTLPEAASISSDSMMLKMRLSASLRMRETLVKTVCVSLLMTWGVDDRSNWYRDASNKLLKVSMDRM